MVPYYSIGTKNYVVQCMCVPYVVFPMSRVPYVVFPLCRVPYVVFPIYVVTYNYLGHKLITTEDNKIFTIFVLRSISR